MIYSQPGLQFEAILSGAPPDLTGSMGFALIEPSTSTVVIARRTTGIREVTTGVYWTQDTAPTEVGTYLVTWDYGGTTAAEELVVTAAPPGFAPTLGGAYATADQVRGFAPQMTADISDEDLVAEITQAESDIDAYLPETTAYTDAGRKVDVTALDTNELRSLGRAVAAQTEYRLHMGPAFFIEGPLAMSGGDITTSKPPPMIAPKAARELQALGLMPLTGSMTPRAPRETQRRFNW